MRYGFWFVLLLGLVWYLLFVIWCGKVVLVVWLECLLVCLLMCWLVCWFVYLGVGLDGFVLGVLYWIGLY